MFHGRLAVVCVALAALAACEKKGSGGVTRADCEHVLAHLTVLEKDEASKPISKYHPSGGDGKDAFLGKCPKVLSAKEVDCYLRATSIASADDCLHRGELDGRIGGAVAVAGGGLGAPPATRQDQAHAELAGMRDRVCACKDLDCAKRVEQDMEALQDKYRDLKDDQAFEDRVEPIFDALVECYDALEDDKPSPKSDPLVAMEKLRDDACACKDKACADGVMDGLMKLAETYKDHKPSDDESARAKALAEQMMECIMKASADPITFQPPDDPRPPPPPPPATTGSTGIAACDDYVAKMEAYIACDKVPQAARDAARQGIDGMRQAWGDTAAMSDDARRAAGDGCKAASDAIVQSAQAMGCTL